MFKLNKAWNTKELILPVVGICPFIGVITGFKAGVMMATLYMVLLIVMAFLISIIRNLIPVQLKLIVIVFLSSTVVTILILFMQMFFYEKSLIPGIYAYLVAVNALILSYSLDEWLTSTFITSIKQALLMSAVVFVFMMMFGLLRELIPLHLLKEPAGAFILLALILALIQWTPGKNTEMINP